MDVLRQESKIWTRKGNLDVFRHAFTSVSSQVVLDNMIVETYPELFFHRDMARNLYISNFL